MKLLSKIFFILFFANSLFSCRKELGNADWDISVMTPIIKTSLGINNLLADSLIQQNPDTSLKIVYNTTLYEFSVDSLVDLPDTITSQVFSILGSFTVQPGAPIMNKVDNKDLDLGSAQVTRIVVKSGYVNLVAKNKIKEKILCTYQIPCATISGTPFEVTDLLPAGTATQSSVFTRKVDISGYTLDLTGPTGNSFNILSSVLKAWIDPNGNPIVITGSDSLEVLVNFEGLVIDYAKGYFGTQNFLSGEKFTNFDLFKKITSGTLNLQDLHLVLTIINGFGVDASLLIHEIKSFNSNSNTTVSLISSIIENTIHVNRAQETYNPSNPVIPTVTSFNLDNTNFKQLIENLPDKLGYSLDISTDPLGNVSSGNDFVYNNYGFRADLDLEIPLSFMAQNLTLTDTVDFSLSKPSGYDINYGTLTLIADNGFPFFASAQMYLLDENNSITDSLMNGNNTIVSAPVDASGKVISKKRSMIPVAVSGKKLENLYNAKRMIIVARFNTTNQPNYIKIYADYLLDLKLTGDFNMTVNKN
jgi:hypothetical protein